MPVWDLVSRALCAGTDAGGIRTASGAERRFGMNFADVGLYPIPILTCDIPGCRITPHTDTHWKGITVQFLSAA
jgi:hypothetical protein